MRPIEVLQEARQIGQEISEGKMLQLIGAIVIALIFVWLLPVLLIAIFTVPMAIAAHVRERFKMFARKTVLTVLAFVVDSVQCMVVPALSRAQFKVFGLRTTFQEKRRRDNAKVIVDYGDSFNPVFTTTGCTGTCLLPTAPFDVTFPSPTTFEVTFDGVISVVSIPSGDASGDTYAWAANKGLQPGGGSAFTLLDTTVNGGRLSCQGSESATTANSCGTLTFAAVGTAPEPSSIALMLLGVGLVFVLRKRNSRGHQLAT